MIYKDQWAEDEKGKKFLFTVGMQRKLEQAGLPVEPASVKKLGGGNGRSSAAPTPSTSTTSYSKPRYEQREQREQRKPSSDSRPFRQQGGDDIAPPDAIQIDPQTGKYIGRMKWYNGKKGYGFLMRGGSDELFFHKSNVIGNPYNFAEGEWVLYDVEETHKGIEAVEIEQYDKK